MEPFKERKIGQPGMPSTLSPFPWTEEDTKVAMLFEDLEGLPMDSGTPIKTVLGFLRELDQLIGKFEEMIGHSDDGLRAWRDRHKRAIDAHIVKLTGFPPLKIWHQGVFQWSDKEWDKRYSYVVDQRRKITDERLTQIGIEKSMRMQFFGQRSEQPRRPILMRSANGRIRSVALGCDWWLSLDFLLERLGGKFRGDPKDVARRFWNPPSGACWGD